MTENTAACLTCRYYISSVGEKGFCRLYDHETTMPEKSCPRFEEKPVREAAETPEIKKMPDKKNRKFTYVLMIGAIASSIFLCVIGLMFGVNLIMSVFTVDTISETSKFFTAVMTAVLFLIACFLLFALGRKYRWAMILEIILTLAALTVLLFFSKSVFDSFLSYTVRYITAIFS